MVDFPSGFLDGKTLVQHIPNFSKRPMIHAGIPLDVLSVLPCRYLLGSSVPDLLWHITFQALADCERFAEDRTARAASALLAETADVIETLLQRL